MPTLILDVMVFFFTVTVSRVGFADYCTFIDVTFNGSLISEKTEYNTQYCKRQQSMSNINSF